MPGPPLEAAGTSTAVLCLSSGELSKWRPRRVKSEKERHNMQFRGKQSARAALFNFKPCLPSDGCATTPTPHFPEGNARCFSLQPNKTSLYHRRRERTHSVSSPNEGRDKTACLRFCSGGAKTALTGVPVDCSQPLEGPGEVFSISSVPVKAHRRYAVFSFPDPTADESCKWLVSDRDHPDPAQSCCGACTFILTDSL